AAYGPLPDWYFLFFDQLLKYDFASGPYTLVGIMILPGRAFGGLLLAPFLDSGPGRRSPKRPVAVALMLLGLSATVWLTYESAIDVHWEKKAETNKPIPREYQLEIDEEQEGYEPYQDSCVGCHGDGLFGGEGPELRRNGLPEDAIKQIAVDGIGDMPSDIFQGSDEELDELADFITSMEEEQAELDEKLEEEEE